MKETRIEGVALALTAIFSLVLSGVVLVSIAWLLLLLSSSVIVRPAFAQSTTGAVQLEAGIAKEEVDGDLKSAMEIYKKIADESSAGRDVRSKALLHLAGCYEKLGRQARQVYEHILRDYADQPAAAQARTRLASLKQQEHPAAPATMTVRKIEWSALGNIGPDDTDGERAIYGDFDGNIVFGDLAGHTKKVIYKHKDSDSEIYFRRSRDFSMVSLVFPATPNRPARLAVIKADGTVYHELVRDDAQGTILGSNWDRNWSWDDHYLVVWSNLSNGGGHLFVVSVADGSRRELSTIETGKFSKAVFSPDGRYVAYCIQPEHNRFGTFRFFVVPAQGGQARLVYESTLQFVLWGLNRLLDWTANGRNLVIVDVSRGHKIALFLLPIKDGTRAGPPTYVRDGSFEDGFTTSIGSLVYRDHASVANGGNEFFIASFEPNGHLEKWQPLDLQPGNSPGWNPWPSFSPDGRQIAYVAHGSGVDNDKLVLRDVKTGQEHVLYQSTTAMACQYARHSPKVFCGEVQTDGQLAIISVVVNSGAVERLGSFPGFGWIQTSSDERTVYELKEDTPGFQLVSLDLATRQETKLEDGNAIVVPAEPPVVARSSDQSLMVRPISGGAWKTLVRLKQNTINIVGTPDGTSLLYEDTDSMGRNSLFRIPLAGGQPERVADFPGNGTGGLHISPDGRQLIAVVFKWDKYDLWILDNFASSAAQSRGAR
jgi:Tol biopolymer transport system component